MIEKIKETLKNNFSGLQFNESTHTYLVNGKKISKSVTALAGQYSSDKPFDTQYWAERKAKERGISKEEIIKEWDAKRDFSANKGTLVHKFMENIYNGIEENIEVSDKELCLKFYNETKTFLLPIASELRIYDIELDVAGTIDQLFYCPQKKQIVLVDWKTNKMINTKNGYNKMVKPFDKFDSCEFYNYSLQLNFYKYIIEKNTELKIDSMKLVWLNSEVNKDYKVFDCVNFQDEIKKIFGA